MSNSHSFLLFLALTVSFIGGFVALCLTSHSSLGWAPFLLWIFSVGLASLCFINRVKLPALVRSDALLLLLITFACVAFRLYRIEDIPFGFWIDEVSAAHNALAIMNRSEFVPFGSTPMFADNPNWVKTPNLYLYFAYCLMWLGNLDRIGVKFISIIPGILAGPLLYFVARSYLSRSMSCVTALLLACMSWHVTLSRWGWDEVLTTSLVVAIAALLLTSERTKVAGYSFFAGILSGLSLFTYLSARVAVAAMLGYLILRLAIKRDRVALSILGSFSLALFLSAAPLIGYWNLDPGAGLARMKELSIMDSVLHGDFEMLLEGLTKHIWMFHYIGDPNERQNFRGEPMLDPLMGALFLVGLVRTVAASGEGKYQLLLIWFVGGMAGSIFSHPFQAPHAYRTGLIAPACCLFAVLGLDLLTGSRRHASRSYAGLVANVLIALTIIYSAAFTIDRYFIKRAKDIESFHSTWGGAPALIFRREIESRVFQPGRIFIGAEWINDVPFFLESELLRIKYPDKKLVWLDLEVKVREPDMALFVSPDYRDDVQRNFSNLKGHIVKDPFGREIVLVAQ